MTDDLARALKRPGALPAFLTALGILGALVVLGVLQATFTALGLVTGSSLDGDYFASIWAAQLTRALAGPLPIAIGAFLCFWQIAPIAPNLRLAHVVTRALLAGAAGALLLVVLGLLFRGLLWLLTLAGLADRGEWGLETPFVDALGSILFSTLATVVAVLPVVILGAVLLWGWLQRHPPKQRLRGTLDEV